MQIYFKLFLYVLILYLYQMMEEKLKNGIINLSALSMKLWPDKMRPNAAALLRNKIYLINGNSLTVTDKARIADFVTLFSQDPDLREGFLNISALAAIMWPDRVNGGALLRNKIRNINGNKLSEADMVQIKGILSDLISEIQTA